MLAVKLGCRLADSKFSPVGGWRVKGRNTSAPALIRSASVPCGTNSSSISPARYLSVNARGSDDFGNEQIILATMPASIIAAIPIRPLPALLLMTVRYLGRLSTNAWMSSIGAPDPPKPPIITTAPSPILATASARLSDRLSNELSQKNAAYLARAPSSLIRKIDGCDNCSARRLFFR